MATNIGDHSQRMLDMLVAGPLPYQYVLTEVASMVHPGKAYRYAMRQVKSQRARVGHEPRNVSDVDAQTRKRINYGARQTVARSIMAFEQSGRIEVYEEGGVKMVRTGPRFVSPPRIRTSTRPVTRQVLLEVEDEVVTFDEMLARVSFAIPDDEAEVMREYIRTRKNPVKVVPKTAEEIRQVGRREILNRTLRPLAKHGRIEVEKVDGIRYIKRGPRWDHPDAAA